jgi:two-component system NtrC family sensor kinase
LTDGINYMSQALAEREKDLEIERRKTSFREKMIAVDSLAGGIAHEVGNSITCIAGLAGEIANDDKNQLSEGSKNSLLHLQQYTEGIVRVTRDLSMLDTQTPDESEWIDINQLLAKTGNLCRYDNRWSNVAITVDLDYGLPAIFASENQFNQVITHILENAFDAISDQTRPNILMQTKSFQQNGISIVIEDNGVGVKGDDFQHIFEPFYTTKPVGHGTGLGLAICWTIIKSHHGDIQAEPSSEGGLKITINLPCRDTTQNDV